MKTIEQIKQAVRDGELKEHHTASQRGYVSRKSDGLVQPYSGRFGRGWIVKTPRYDSTQYCHITYYVFDGGEA